MITRNHAFDNLRSLMVLCIVLLHAACAYAAIIPWWHAQDAKHPAFDILIVLVDTFALPVLFFVAGVFAHASYDRHGSAGFVLAKLRRLGIPLVAMTVLYLPTMVYLGHLRRTENPLPFFQYWLHWMSTFTDWHFVAISNMEQGAKYADSASPHHLWFLSLLLLFFLAYAAWRCLFKARTPARFSPSLPVLCLTTVAVTATGFAAINLFVPAWTWALFGPLLLFQLTRLPLYAGLFLFGVLARPHLDRPRPFPGPVWLWPLLFLLALALFVALMILAPPTPGPASLGQVAAHGLLRAVLAVSATGLSVNLTHRFLTGPSRWRDSLSSVSYDIYIWHMPLVVYVQAALLGVSLPLWIKALTAFIAAVAVSWAIGQASKAVTNRLRA